MAQSKSISLEGKHSVTASINRGISRQCGEARIPYGRGQCSQPG